jgi:hypothetical protein
MAGGPEQTKRGAATLLVKPGTARADQTNKTATRRESFWLQFSLQVLVELRRNNLAVGLNVFMILWRIIDNLANGLEHT